MLIIAHYTVPLAVIGRDYLSYERTGGNRPEYSWDLTDDSNYMDTAAREPLLMACQERHYRKCRTNYSWKKSIGLS